MLLIAIFSFRRTWKCNHKCNIITLDTCLNKDKNIILSKIDILNDSLISFSIIKKSLDPKKLEI